jgi:hypothetical protein
MPVSRPRKERLLIELFLSAYDSDSWNNCGRVWLEDFGDNAVELLATKLDGTTLAIEHTLIQPFVGEKTDSHRFLQTFLPIDSNPALTIPGRRLFVSFPVESLKAGYNWNSITDELLLWLKEKHASFPESRSEHNLMLKRSPSRDPFEITVGIEIEHLPGLRGCCLIRRDHVPKNFCDVVETALRKKLPKLIETPADRRILLLEFEHLSLRESTIHAEIEKDRPNFPDLW